MPADFVGIPGTHYNLGAIVRDIGGMGQLDPDVSGLVNNMSTKFFSKRRK